MPTYGWGVNEPEIKPVAQGGDTIATYATKVMNAISNLFDTLNTFPWANATQSSAGFMSKDDKKAVDGIADLGTFNKMFFSQTSGSYLAPRTGVYRITLKGGGGGGAGAQTDVFSTGASGGEGGTLIFYTTLTKNQSYPYIIGAGGAGGVSGDASTATGGDEGGTTSFNTTTTIAGGKGGVALSSGGIGGSGGYAFTIPSNASHWRIPGAIGGAHIRGYTRWASAPTSGGNNTGVYVGDNNRRAGCGGAGACGNSNTANPTVTYQAQAGNAGSILIEYAG